MNKAIFLKLNLSSKHLEHLSELLDDLICYEDWSSSDQDEKEKNEHQKFALEELDIAVNKYLKNESLVTVQ